MAGSGKATQKETHILERIIEYNNFLDANKNSAKGKRFNHDVLRFENDLGANIMALEQEFLSGEYQSGKFHERYIYVPQTRLIQISQYRDRVAQQAIYCVLAPILDKQYIWHSYACRKGKGALAAAQTLQCWLQKIHRMPNASEWRCGKIDAAKFFYRLDHGVIMDTLAQYVDDTPFMRIMDNIINCSHTAFGLPEGKSCTEAPCNERLFDVGVPIGTPTSQTMANMVMNEADQFAKHALNIHYYMRYMDDIIILAPSKAILCEWMGEIEQYMLDKLKLRCNSKTCIVPFSHGIPFVGKRIWGSHVLLRRSTSQHMKRSIKYLSEAYSAWIVDFDYVKQVMASYYGMLSKVDGHDLAEWVSANATFTRNWDLHKSGGDIDERRLVR